MRRQVLALLSGALFTLGLTVSGMIQPGKVLAFLDVAGAWDPSLALVMLGAIIIYAVIDRASRRRARPWDAEEFAVPARRHIDARLIAGAAVFGVGWGLVGLCPGPAWSALGTGNPRVIAFVIAMLAGISLVRTLDERAARRAVRAGDG